MDTANAMRAALQPTGREPYFVAQAAADKRRDRITGQAIADLEDFRQALREADALTPKVDDFVNRMLLAVTVSEDPAAALDAVFRQLAACPARCPAAHPDDPTPCDGPAVVTILDRQNTGVDGCAHHAARLLASLDGGRVHPLPDAPTGTAIRVHKTAATLRPFPWREAGR